jgi:hypothetical protein
MFRQVVLTACLVMCFFPQFTSAQYILAGQNSGTNVYYNDIDDLFLDSFSWGQQDSETMDLDNDGTYDLYLWTNWTYYSHIDYMSSDAGAMTNGNLQISAVPEDSSWIRKHLPGDTIDSRLNWVSAQTTFYCPSSTGSSGTFRDEGYLAFRICNPDTVYGWVRIWRSAYLGESKMQVFDYATRTYYLGTGTAADPEEIRNWVNGNLLSVFVPGRFGNGILRCISLDGKILFEQEYCPGINTYPLSGIKRGIYILHLIDKKGHCTASRILY